MNPCPCGYLGHASGRCQCTPEQIARYVGKLSGPLLDRIDMHVRCPPWRLGIWPPLPLPKVASSSPACSAGKGSPAAASGCCNARLSGPSWSSTPRRIRHRWLVGRCA
jgi:magnesium chelatase family protein